jgi:hypothetical protein
VSELLSLFGMVQANGGLLVGVVWLVIEQRRMRRDFTQHKHGKDGKPFIQIAD